jgi:hypothetical protein
MALWELIATLFIKLFEFFTPTVKIAKEQSEAEDVQKAYEKERELEHRIGGASLSDMLDDAKRMRDKR